MKGTLVMTQLGWWQLAVEFKGQQSEHPIGVSLSHSYVAAQPTTNISPSSANAVLWKFYLLSCMFVLNFQFTILNKPH